MQVRAKAVELGELEERYWHDFNDFQIQLRAHVDERDVLLRKVRGFCSDHEVLMHWGKVLLLHQRRCMRLRTLTCPLLHCCTRMLPWLSPPMVACIPEPASHTLHDSSLLQAPARRAPALLHSFGFVQIDRTSAHLERLRRTNVYNDAFHIWHEGPFATISGFRLGRTPACPSTGTRSTPPGARPCCCCTLWLRQGCTSLAWHTKHATRPCSRGIVLDVTRTVACCCLTPGHD